MEEECVFTGTIGRVSRCKIYGDRTVMLNDIRTEDGEWVAHHIWFKNAVWSEKIKIGQQIYFNADVVRYRKKDYLNDKKIKDFKLTNAGMVTFA